MNSRAGRNKGITLIEIVVAVAILAVAVLAAAGLQATGLRATRTARIIQDLNATAQSEMNLWRGTRLDQTAPSSATCITSSDVADSCTVEVRPCRVAASVLACADASVALPAAHLITVTAAREDGRSITLRSVVGQ